MNILLTADLHLLRATQEHTLSVLASWVREFRPEVLAVAGDVASASRASEALSALRGIFPDGMLAVCLGNHDFWLHEDARQACASLDQVVDEFWAPAAAQNDAVLLDRMNLELPGLCLAGAYGHYDLGFALPNLAYGEVKISTADYLRGHCPAVSTLRWRDFELMPANAGDALHRLAAQEVIRLEQRLLASRTNPVLVVTHTAPFPELLGIPDLPAGITPPPRAFFRAYLGNQRMGEMLRRYAHRLCGVVCGHTHRPAGPVDINGVPGINVGSDYGVPRGVVYAVEDRRFCRVLSLAF